MHGDAMQCNHHHHDPPPPDRGSGEPGEPGEARRSQVKPGEPGERGMGVEPGDVLSPGEGDHDRHHMWASIFLSPPGGDRKIEARIW